jgi:Peptidase family S41
MISRKAFLAAVSAAGAVTLTGTGAADSEKRYSPEAVRNDLDGIWSTLIDVGAQPFRTSSRERVELQYRNARASIVAPMTPLQAWLTIAQVLGALNDGHVGLGFPGALKDAPFAFPLFFTLPQAGDALVVLRDRTQTIPLGSRIVSIDGVDAATYVSTALATLGAQTPSFNRTRVTMGGAWPAVALFGAGPQYRVRWITPHNVAGEADIAATTASESKIAKPVPPAPYTYETIQDGRIGYIDYRSCEDLPRFQTFLAATFSRIKEAPVRALIVDVRRNGGGDSDLNDELWQYASDKAFKQFGEVIEKSCARIKREYGRTKYVEIYGDRAWSSPDGTTISSGSDPQANLIQPRPLVDRYNGPVYLLISAQTFSSAMSCALAAKDYGLATIVGEETGEPVNSTGEVYTYVTPNLGFSAWLTTKVFLAPRLHPDGQGVLPDVVVETSPADVAAGRDPVLQRAIGLALG